MTAVTAFSARTSLLLPVAGAITLLLFFLMSRLIDAPSPPPVRQIDPVQVSIGEIVADVAVREPLPDAPETLAMPDIPSLSRDVPAARGNPGVSGQYPVSSPASGPVDPGDIALDPGSTPLTRAAPVYPPSQARRGQEASCLVRYDVVGNGRTTNIQISGCEPAFAAATHAAVEHWRYNATMADGADHIVRSGLTTRLDFTLND